MKSLELYVHIPFCIKKCAYCDFLSGPSDEETREKYIELLCREIEECKGKTEEYEVVTVFFGGGTPSILHGEQIQKIMLKLRESFVFAEEAEITLEMNPGTVTMEKLIAYKKAGINRLSIGLQSIHNEELKLLGRIHSYEEFVHSYKMARKAGFENISIDLISAIPGQTVASWCETIKTMIDLQPEHISAYSLIIEEGTPFYEKYGEGAETDLLPSEEAEREMYWQTKRILREAGYERYEISNYAREGYTCRHNIGYWERTPYLGFGIGAASLFEETRYTNPSDIEEYERCFSEKFKAEKLSTEEQMEEFMFLGLRMMKGISRRNFAESFGKEIEEVYGERMEKLKSLALLEENGDRICLTEKGIDVSNSVFVEFMF